MGMDPQAAPTPSSHLSYPAPSPASRPTSPPSIDPSSSKGLPPRSERLYVGNLHQSVDEYTLLQLFSKFGKISKLNFLFHKAGPAKGKPRGYAFIEFSTKEDATKALVGLNDKVVRGRKIVVTFAQQSNPPQDASSSSMSQRLGGGPIRRGGTDTSRTTTLSLIKTHNRPANTSDKIAALEEKLKQMKQDSNGPQQQGSSSAGAIPVSAGLPPKPPPPTTKP